MKNNNNLPICRYRIITTQCQFSVANLDRRLKGDREHKIQANGPQNVIQLSLKVIQDNKMIMCEYNVNFVHLLDSSVGSIIYTRRLRTNTQQKQVDLGLRSLDRFICSLQYLHI